MASQVDSILYRDFPFTIGLSREDLEELLGRPELQQQGQQGDAQQALDASNAYLEAFVDSLPEVRSLFDEHARLLKESEDKAGEYARQAPLAACVCMASHHPPFGSPISSQSRPSASTRVTACRDATLP